MAENVTKGNYFILSLRVVIMVEDFYILIVDDQPGVRRFLYEAFNEEGYRVELASTGMEAINKASARPPSIVLLDIKMPGMTGLDTLEELLKIIPDLPVIMMTAYGELDIITEARKKGVRCFINKPFDLIEVRYLIKGLLLEIDDKRKMEKDTG